MKEILRLNKIQVNYGNVVALKDISIVVHEGEFVSLIGSNGAGKTTTLLSIIGGVKPASGTIVFQEKDITKLISHKRVASGIALVPEGRRIFPDLSVYENMEMGGINRKDAKGIKGDIEKYFELFPILDQRREQHAGTLSGGEQQMLAICRALMSKPSLLLLDEPSLGLAPLIVEDVFKILKDLNQKGSTILLVEQNAKKALAIANRGYVIETGRIALEGKSEDLIHNPKVVDAYLGGGI